jgi:adenylate cyclase
LVERGVSTIAFDIEFFRHGVSDQDDLLFAQAVTRARRVVLVQRFEVAHAEGREIWRRWNPIPALADAARALAPVPVPDAPVVSWFWSFLRTPQVGEVPALPAVVLQVHAMPAMASFMDALRRAGVEGLDGLPQTAEAIATAPDVLRVMQTIRRQVVAQPAAASKLKRQLRAADDAATSGLTSVAPLLALYTGRDSAYLNFYGPPGTVCTVPYDQILARQPDEAVGCPLRNAIVFVGLAHSRLARADQADTYHTIYESADGEDFSGVELHATAVANLLTGTALVTLSPRGNMTLLLLVGVCLGASGYWMRTRKRRLRGGVSARVHAALLLTGLAGVYCAAVYLLFRHFNVSIPLIVPVAVQLPAAMILGLLVPPIHYQEQVKAVCLATDADGSTAVGQRLSNAEFARLLGEYNRVLARPVWLHGGTALGPEGDGFIGLWCSSRVAAEDADAIEPECRLLACLTATEMTEAARQFNIARTDDTRLPVRIGLTTGTVTIHSDADRGVFNVVGDAVNVAARLRDLNRELGTGVLVSEDVVKGLEAKLHLRPVLTPITLKGVARPPVVFEVVGAAAPGEPRLNDSSEVVFR